MSNAMQVNPLPMRTYRWLNMNAEAMLSSGERTGTASAQPLTLPAGVLAQQAADAEQVRLLFAADAAEIRAGDASAIPPNGDAFVQSAQEIPTGMGSTVDALFEDAGILTDIYTVEEGVAVEEPLFLRFSPPDASSSLALQVFHVKKGASLTVLMDYYTHRTFSGYFGIRSLFLAEEGARLTVVRVQMLGGGFTHFDDIGAVARRDAHISLVRLEFGTEKSYGGLCCNLLGDEASFDCELGYLARRKQSFDYNYIVTHRGKRTKGTMHFHGVLLDSAKKLLRGTIDFRAGASGADGEENEDALLLSDTAVNRTIPIILCQEEDINGHHGATIGQLADDMMFYLQSRGFSAEEAKKQMIRAKILRVANLIPAGDLKSHVNAYLCDSL